MAQHNYAFQGFNKELMAKAVGRDIEVSPKVAIEICNFLRHKKLIQAKQTLERVIEKKQAIPFKRFMNGIGHRPGKIASGRYPLKASGTILKLLESAEANAQTKGLNTNDLEIVHICAQRAQRQMHYGRNHGRQFKRAHVEIVLQETPKTDKKESQSKKEEKPKKATAGEKKTEAQK